MLLVVKGLLPSAMVFVFMKQLKVILAQKLRQGDKKSTSSTTTERKSSKKIIYS